ncbi:MAG: NAD-dependent epimerase/dehydratase family protein [Candidatus Methylomirabilales bacterium]
MARVLILGGAGFIGYHLGRYLAEQSGHQITLIDNLSRGELDEELREFLTQHPLVELLTGDLTEQGTLRRLSEPFDFVYLLAGLIGVRNVQARPAEVIHTNTAILLNTLEWLAEKGCRRLLFASTGEVYAGSVELDVALIPTAENVPLAVLEIQHPRSSYAVTKMLGEAAVIHYARAFGFEAVVVRYHNVYGSRMGFDHVVPELIERIHRKMDPLPVYGQEQTRAFCYVTDAVAASEVLMNCPLDNCEIVHVGNDQEEITIKELLGKLLDLSGFHPRIEALPAPPGAVDRRCPDISKLRALTGFQPKVGIDRGLALTWEWYQQKLCRGESGASLAASREDAR